MKRTFFGFLIALSLSYFPSVFADHVTLDFPLFLDRETNFYCTVIADKGVLVHMDTHNIDLRGACSGEYVVRPGHLLIPTALVNTYAFTAVQTNFRDGNITLDTPDNTPIHCVLDAVGGRLLYRNGDGACFTSQVSSKK